MKKPVVSFLKDLRANPKLHALDEASIRQAVVLRLLSLLNWDIFNVDDVAPDFTQDSEKVAYALRIGPAVKVLLEVKTGPETLDECHKRLVAFAARANAELAVHTNGLRWWFYLASARGALIQKRCHFLDLVENRPEEAAADLSNLLSREKVADDQHLEAAKAACQEQRRKMAAEVLPEAWNRVLAGPNKILVEILSDAAEKLCGHKAEPGAVEGFIRSNLQRWNLPAERPLPPPAAGDSRPLSGPAPEAAAANSSDIKTKKPEFFAGKSINSFSLQGNTFAVKSWEDMLLTLCNRLAAEHPQDFEKVLWLYDDQTPCFSRYSNQLKIPEKIKKTNIYVETKLDPEEIVKTVGDLLTEFGYGHEELVITTQ